MSLQNSHVLIIGRASGNYTKICFPPSASDLTEPWPRVVANLLTCFDQREEIASPGPLEWEPLSKEMIDF